MSGQKSSSSQHVSGVKSNNRFLVSFSPSSYLVLRFFWTTNMSRRRGKASLDPSSWAPDDDLPLTSIHPSILSGVVPLSCLVYIAVCTYIQPRWFPLHGVFNLPPMVLVGSWFAFTRVVFPYRRERKGWVDRTKVPVVESNRIATLEMCGSKAICGVL